MGEKVKWVVAMGGVSSHPGEGYIPTGKALLPQGGLWDKYATTPQVFCVVQSQRKVTTGPAPRAAVAQGCKHPETGYNTPGFGITVAVNLFRPKLVSGKILERKGRRWATVGDISETFGDVVE